MARAGRWSRAVLHGHVPEHPTTQAAGTEYFSLDVEDVSAAGSRPDRLSAVSGPQERVLRRTVEQIVDCVPVVPPHLRAADVGLTGGRAEDPGPLSSWNAGKATRVPWLFMRHAPPRSSLPEPQVVEQLVEVPIPPLWLTARTTVAFVGGTCGVGLAVPTGGWSAPTTPGRTAQLGHRQPKAVHKYWATSPSRGLTSL